MLDNEPNERHEDAATDHSADSPVTDEATPKRRRTRKSAASAASAAPEEPADSEPAEKPTRRRRKAATAETDTEPETSGDSGTNDDVAPKAVAPAHSVLFMAPSPVAAVVPVVQDIDADAGDTPTRRRRRRSRAGEAEEAPEPTPVVAEEDAESDEDETARRRRRGRRGRGRGKGGNDEAGEHDEETPTTAEADEDEGEDSEETPLTRRRRRRRRKGEADGDSDGDVHTVVKIRERRSSAGNGGDEVQGVSGSTRLEAKRQRRRDGREQRRTRPPILTEAEFLARREAVDRVMVIRDSGDRTQIAVLEDGVLVEHYVTRAATSTMVGNVYLGKVQNVLPSMEAAFVDLGRGRNAVLYAGEVNWDAAGLEGKARSIEQALKSGDTVLVQVTKDPVGHKGARLSSHIALSGRHLVYVPNGNTSGISRKLSDVERRRLRDILKKLVPEGAGVIVRTAAEGASEEDLERDVTRLQAQWEDIQTKAAEGGAPVLLYAEPELVLRVVRDLFNEDFKELIIQGDVASETVESYLSHVSPDLVDRVRRYAGAADAFAAYRIDEQILKGLDRKVFLPSGGHLVIDRTEAMTVVDVNTGKYTGAGGNLEETVTRNNLEAAEEIVRQLRLRDLGGIVVIDFIDMVLESNRELVLRRLTECLGRDRTKHQVTEITSLGLVQMTRKRIGAGLLEAFSEPCEHCKGRGVMIHMDPVPERRSLAPAPVKEVEAPKAAKSAKAPAYDVDTEGYDLSRYANTEDDDLIEVTEETDEQSEAQVRRRTRRGGRRRTRL
ncbi:hypothetical protein Rhe02_94180 [Rhizocola hellebori]|uniref:Ribonuclease E n=1 Tax=Rhizocola hellebori TaxID=1392758 RepID=A0A8J3VMK1_9ACTN|nr:Rne/Rng family ribonuclease [Rhizocola hellebori]GIH11351.1 hypothetical protein Rhe02_94180 [Rhizocola hellebori]